MEILQINIKESYREQVFKLSAIYRQYNPENRAIIILMKEFWQPKYSITSEMARRLMEIEAAKAVVEHTPLPPTVEAELRQRARIRATH